VGRLPAGKMPAPQLPLTWLSGSRDRLKDVGPTSSRQGAGSAIALDLVIRKP
jgi:hypothetical protein